MKHHHTEEITPSLSSSSFTYPMSTTQNVIIDLVICIPLLAICHFAIQGVGGRVPLFFFLLFGGQVSSEGKAG